jgi:hypothetical protein
VGFPETTPTERREARWLGTPGGGTVGQLSFSATSAVGWLTILANNAPDERRKLGQSPRRSVCCGFFHVIDDIHVDRTLLRFQLQA